MNQYQRASCSIYLIVFLGFACPSSSLAQRELPSGKSTLFSGSGNCSFCHQSNGTANTSSAGKDVSQPTLWRSTMMANAAKDPFWQAMVTAEIHELPALSDAIQNRCTACHTPMGHEESEQQGKPNYLLADALADPLAMDGVSCTLCHQITPDNLGTGQSFSGGYAISKDRVTFGPVQNPLVSPMKQVTGFEPVYGSHMETSALCATCHTLFTPFVDNNGAIAGDFPEQTPYLEWLASDYPLENKQCQSCHVPALNESIPLSSLPPSAPARTPFFMHAFAGGNTFLLRILKAHGEELRVTARSEHFDSTLALTERQLHERTVSLSGTATVDVDSLLVRVRVNNETGHKFPTGFPSRRAWLHVLVRDQADRTVFESGAWDTDGRIDGEDVPFEPHFNGLSSDRQVQIYEMVAGDVDSVVTHRLLRFARRMKDNRIPPRGFGARAMVNDTISVIGVPPEDGDFNRADGKIGSGSDDVRYTVRIHPEDGPFRVSVQLLYQSVNPRFIEHIRSYPDSIIDRFIRYYDSVDNAPEILRHLEFTTSVSGQDDLLRDQNWRLGHLYPQPVSQAKHRWVFLPISNPHSEEEISIEVFTILGVRIWDAKFLPTRSIAIPVFSIIPGVYRLRVQQGVQAAFRTLVIMP